MALKAGTVGVKWNQVDNEGNILNGGSGGGGGELPEVLQKVKYVTINGVFTDTTGGTLGVDGLYDLIDAGNLLIVRGGIVTGSGVLTSVTFPLQAAMSNYFNNPELWLTSSTGSVYHFVVLDDDDISYEIL